VWKGCVTPPRWVWTLGAGRLTRHR
jgi:hypothetical protein